MSIPTVLVIGSGAAGGVGRVEKLLTTALELLGEEKGFSVSTLYRRRHPDYLGATGPADTSRRSDVRSVPIFTIEILSAAARLRPAAVVFSHVNLAQVGLVLRRLQPSLPVLSWAHGIEVWRPLSGIRRHALRRSSVVMASSSFTRDRLIDIQGVNPDRAVTVPLTPDPGLSARPVVQRAPGHRLLTVSRLDASEREKGVDWVIRSLPGLARAVPGVSYTVVGDGEDRHRLETLAIELGVSDRITFTGIIDGDRLVREYQESDIFVLPSRKEGFGLVFVEAMSFGIPVVAHASGGALDVVRHGDGGFLVQSEPELEPALTGLLTDVASRTEAGRRARLLVEREFSFERFAECLGWCLYASGAGLETPSRARWQRGH